MLQRIQSLWALLAVACAVLTLKFSFYSGNKLIAPARTFEYLTGTTNVLILILTVVIIVGGLVNIFNYKNRKLQLRATLALFLLSLINIVLYFRETQKFAEGNYDLTALLSFSMPVFFFLAAKGIYRDQKLVKSADRLR